MSDEAILVAEHLDKRFGGVVAADDIAFSLRRGEMRCIIGPNGAGKSTFFALLAGILRPERGKIFLAGRDITALAAFRRVRLGLGITFQTNRTFHALSVDENLETARRAGSAAADDAHFRHAFAGFGLESQRDVMVRELAHHHRQWLEICMALRRGPSVLLLDEPTAGLSPGETMLTADILSALARDGLAIVVVEHDMAFVRAAAERVTVLHQGAVFADGTTAEIVAREDVRRIYLGRAGEKR